MNPAAGLWNLCYFMTVNPCIYQLSTFKLKNFIQFSKHAFYEKIQLTFLNAKYEATGRSWLTWPNIKAVNRLFLWKHSLPEPPQTANTILYELIKLDTPNEIESYRALKWAARQIWLSKTEESLCWATLAVCQQKPHIYCAKIWVTSVLSFNALQKLNQCISQFVGLFL